MGSSRGSSSTRRRSSTSSGWTWTNKRHAEFLNSMEASFVRTMLNNTLSPPPPPPPLDLCLPDASDSTLDLDTQPTKPARRHDSTTSDILGSTRVRTDERIRRLLYQPHNISPQDQVVPEFENRRVVVDDDSGTDEKDHQLDATPPT